MASLDSGSGLPISVRETLDRLRGMIHRYVWLQTFLLAGSVGLAFFWLTGAIDYFPVLMGASESPRWARAAMLISLAACTIGLLVWHGVRRSWVVWRDSTLALLLERRFPQLRHALITTVQAEQTKGRRLQDPALLPHDPELLAVTRAEAIRTLEQVDLDAVMHWKPIRWQATVLGGLMAMSLLLMLWQPDWTWHWGKRLFGLSTDAWPRMSRLAIQGLELEVPSFSGESESPRYVRTFVDGKLTVPRGQGGRLMVHADLHAKKVPENCTLTYRSADGHQGRAALRRLLATSNETVPFVLEGPPVESVDQNYAISLQGGDVRIAGLRLEVVEPPQLNELRLAVRYPTYLARNPNSSWIDETIPYRTGLRLPQGTHVTFLGTANLPLERSECRLSVTASDGPTEHQFLEAEGKDHGFELEAGILQSNWLVEWRLWDIDGHCSSKVQPYVIGVLPDEIPSVDMTLAGIGSAITEQAVLPIEAKIKDDHGVASSRIEIFVNEQPPIAIPLEVPANGQLQREVDLRALRDEKVLSLAAGQSLGLTMLANDFFDLGEMDRFGRASPVQLGIVTPSQLLVLLERRELAMRSRLELIIGELNQFNELLVKMRQVNRSDVAADANPSGGEQAAAPSDTAPPSSDDAEGRERLQLLRAQQGMAQVEKSRSELAGIELEIGQIRRELINNRVDSQDRQERLENRVRIPIQNVLQGSFAELARRTQRLEAAFHEGPVADALIAADLESLGETLTALNAILNDMVDIQDFNEVVDMVRSMVDDQGKIIDRTKAEQKKRLFDQFK